MRVPGAWDWITGSLSTIQRLNKSRHWEYLHYTFSSTTRSQGSFACCLLKLVSSDILTFGRSWTILGHAIRHATALGLQLRVTAGSIHESEKATRSRTWFALYTLEITLAEYTGRPCSITALDISVPIDVSYESAASLSPDHPTEYLVDGRDASLSNLTRITDSPHT